jgi:hypothetical protein
MANDRCVIYINDFRKCYRSASLDEARTGYLQVADPRNTEFGLVGERYSAVVFDSVAAAKAFIAEQGWLDDSSCHLGLITAYVASL